MYHSTTKRNFERSPLIHLSSTMTQPKMWKILVTFNFVFLDFLLRRILQYIVHFYPEIAWDGHSGKKKFSGHFSSNLSKKKHIAKKKSNVE